MEPRGHVVSNKERCKESRTGSRSRDGHTHTHTHTEKFVKSGERTDNGNGRIQDRPNIFNGSIISPPTHHKTNKFCYTVYCDVLGGTDSQYYYSTVLVVAREP